MIPGSIAHLFFNMFTLFMFGITLERVLGDRAICSTISHVE